ncbi:hypothetical protein JKG47_22120 [Acidithiobacillus sp. MC6.1]|nr:hypothetical protein [Acidithiobacillus sp. MC6.1]
MEKMARTVLPFKLAATNESMTALSGLILFGECIQGSNSQYGQESLFMG